ncbi:MAG TPA: DNA mismatch repair protein MutS, partial [Deltaproteobacteria bacterium]|nr:DNA mismatch repair protein MutS [Deltaproteobacteria bacterium]
MMGQYLEIKKDYPGTILFYRMGDFYEMFFEDALVASRALGLALTTRDRGRENPVPMCGVPCHSANPYISRLIRQGYKVAVCEQGEAGSTGKGLVHREVVQVITPGLIVEDDHLTSEKANYLMALACDPRGSRFGIAFIDISTGDFRVTEVDSHRDLLAEMHRVSPSEVVAHGEGIVPEGFYATLRNVPLPPERAKALLTGHFNVLGIEGLGLKDREAALVAAGMVLDYVRETRKGALPHITGLRFYSTGRYLILGTSTRRNLELFESISGDRKNTLFGVMNRTSTPMGARLLADWISFPLMDPAAINLRLDAVEETARSQGKGDGLKAVLKEIPDLERIVGRISAGSASPRDVRSLADGLGKVPELRAMVGEAESGLLRDVYSGLNPLHEVIGKIDATVVAEPPARLGDGGVIAPGLDAGLDDLRLLRRDSRQWIANLEARERQATGIGSLKVGYNKVFGYYIEISHAHASKAPESYTRKQTLVNAERFVTPELKEYEAKILGAQDAIARIEARLFAGLLEFLVRWIPE